EDQGHWRLAEHVLAVLQGRDREPGVHLARQADVDRVDPAAFDRGPDALGITRRDVDQLDLRHLRVGRGVHAAHRAGTQDDDPQRLRFRVHSRQLNGRGSRGKRRAFPLVEDVMPDNRQQTLQRFEDRLARLEALRQEKPARWQLFHLHNALGALEEGRDADLHLDEFDRHELEREYPELEADRVPSVDEIRTRYSLLGARG